MSREIEVWADWQELGYPGIDNALSFDLAREVGPFFRIKPRQAEEILQEVREVVGGWRDHANSLGIARAEQEIMTAAFES